MSAIIQQRFSSHAATTLPRMPSSAGTVLSKARTSSSCIRRNMATTLSASPKFNGLVGGKGQSSGNKQTSNARLIAGASLAAFGLGQYYLGDNKDFFEHKFITSKKPVDLADFYGTEDFMEVFCVLPFMVDLMMRGADIDEEGTAHAWGLLGPGALEVSIDFDEREVDTTGDGKLDTIAWFNKKEHFHDTAPWFLGGFTLWEMTQNFGYQMLENGQCEVYHHGESFKGFFPVQILFRLHSKYVAWATERYINSSEFGTEDREDEAEEFRHNIPLHVFSEFIVGLTREVEKAKDEAAGMTNVKTQQELEVTLKRLKTISKSMEDSEGVDQVTLPRLVTLRSHKTNVSRVHLHVSEPETKDAIRTAMRQIGSSKGQKHELVSEMYHLARRTTLSAIEQQRGATADKTEGGQQG